MNRPLLTDETLEQWWEGEHANWINCPEQYCDEHLAASGYCMTCDREYPYCPTCLDAYYGEDEANDCYRSHRTVLDDIVDAVGK